MQKSVLLLGRYSISVFNNYLLSKKNDSITEKFL